MRMNNANSLINHSMHIDTYIHTSDKKNTLYRIEDESTKNKMAAFSTLTWAYVFLISEFFLYLDILLPLKLISHSVTRGHF